MNEALFRGLVECALALVGAGGLVVWGFRQWQ